MQLLLSVVLILTRIVMLLLHFHAVVPPPQDSANSAVVQPSDLVSLIQPGMTLKQVNTLLKEEPSGSVGFGPDTFDTWVTFYSKARIRVWHTQGKVTIVEPCQSSSAQ